MMDVLPVVVHPIPVAKASPVVRTQVRNIYLLPKFHGLTTGHVQHVGRHGADVLQKVLPSVQVCDHPEGGLLMIDRNMVDVASGGALMDKTPATARHLISNMASNMQQFKTMAE
ncbi:hypothetical protein CR513_55598, partial [Mucuna pruriens]